MIKKLSLLLSAVAVLALAIPALASAHAVTSSAGKLAKAGAEGAVITGTGSDVTLTSGAVGPITCATITLKGKLTVNDGTNVTGEGNGEKPNATDCTNKTNVVDVEEVHVTKLTAEGTTQTVNFDATVKITSKSPITCVFTGVNVPFTYTAGGSTIGFSEAGGITSTGGCGAATLDGSFAIEIGETPVILD